MRFFSRGSTDVDRYCAYLENPRLLEVISHCGTGTVRVLLVKRKTRNTDEKFAGDED
jgi:hypothetical protein